ncbi:hypothetical protein ACM640_11240 [Lactiplantibacillus plantarum]|uniref:hypothetical protein n=1 Tax=Lactiplantibacillus plantarum TaxID=1590 RepID=UPI003AFFC722
MSNKDIREKMKHYRLLHWEVANQIGISDGRLSVWLRTPLTDERKKESGRGN